MSRSVTRSYEGAYICIIYIICCVEQLDLIKPKEKVLELLSSRHRQAG